MLSQRRQHILQALVEDYITYASPVGSKTLVNRYGIAASPATVRNELSALEEAGYISSPHTSAGRVPTDSGYREFVNGLLDHLPELKTHHEFEDLLHHAREVDDLLQQTSCAMTRLTDCFSMVLAPSLFHVALKQISLVALSNTRIMIIVVTADEQVLNRSVELPTPIESHTLAHIQHALQSLLPILADQDGASKANHMVELPEILRTEPASYIVQEVLLCLHSGERTRHHSQGLSALLSKPEFSQSNQLLPVLKVLEDNAMLMELFNTLGQKTQAQQHLMHVGIGSENATPELSGVSVVAAEYGHGKHAGIVAVIGPTRMDYSHVISAVRSAQTALNKI